MKELGFAKAIERLEEASSLDPVIGKIRHVVQAVVQPQNVRDLLHGVPFGHPLHPVEVQIPIGTWTSAAILDLLPGTSKGSGLLLGIGVVGVGPAAVLGWTDWADLHEQQKRVGLVHAASNVLAATLYAASVVQRVRGRNGSGRAL